MAVGPLDWDDLTFFRFDAAQVDELVTMCAGGKTMREVAEHFGAHGTTVAIYLRRRSVPVRRAVLDVGGVIRRPGRQAEAVMDAVPPAVDAGGADPTAGHGVVTVMWSEFVIEAAL